MAAQSLGLSLTDFRRIYRDELNSSLPSISFDLNRYLNNPTPESFTAFYNSLYTYTIPFPNNPNTPAVNALREWGQHLNDPWVPNQQIPRQGANLAKLIETLSPSGTVDIFGHSLGAGIGAVATKQLISDGYTNKVGRLTLFDAPEDGNSRAVGGKVGIDNIIKYIADNSTVLIDNYWSDNTAILSGHLGGYGKPYPYAANIHTTEHPHTSLVHNLYQPSIAWDERGADDHFILTSNTFDASTPIGGYKEWIGASFNRFSTDCEVGKTLNDLISCDKLFVPSKTVKFNILNTLNIQPLALDSQAMVYKDGNQYLNLVSGSPILAYSDFLVDPNIVGFDLGFDWLNSYSDDMFKVWINDTLVYSLDGLLANKFGNESGLISLDAWRDQLVTITFGVISNNSGSHVRITSMNVVRQQSSVPESPISLDLVFGLLCLAGIAQLSRRRMITSATLEGQLV